MTSALFSPIRLADLELPNRIVVAPMCQYSAADGVATDWHLTHLGMLANSGAGMLVIEATHVERRGRITHGCLGLYSDDCEAALERVVYHCHHIGSAKIAIQLAHAGRKASSQRPWEGAKALPANEDPWPTIGPSAVPFGPGWHTPSAMTEEDMAHVTAAFTDAAKRSLRIGFDAIELHFAHGYLLHSFVSPLSNKRNDAYGGSFEGRMRFPLEVVRSVRAAVPMSVPLGARITGTDWVEGGLTGDDAVAMGKALKAAGLDYVDISSANITPESRWPSDPGFNVPIAERVRRECGGLAVRAVGMIVSAKQAEDIIAQGKADMIAMARAFLDDPHWAWHAAQTLGADVTRPVQYARTAPKLWPGAAMRG
jgi:2,4-dienoyl-CoA reductase-like NADH-dependent reductase (Old Yellow Enzyme family)